MVKLSKQYRRAVRSGMAQVREGQVLVGYFVVDALVSVAIANYSGDDVYDDDIRILQRIRKQISFV